MWCREGPRPPSVAGAAAQVNGIRAVGGTLNHCPVGLPNHLVKMPQNIRWRVHCGEVLSLVRLTGAV